MGGRDRPAGNRAPAPELVSPLPSLEHPVECRALPAFPGQYRWTLPREGASSIRRREDNNLPEMQPGPLPRPLGAITGATSKGTWAGFTRRS